MFSKKCEIVHEEFGKANSPSALWKVLYIIHQYSVNYIYLTGQFRLMRRFEVCNESICNHDWSFIIVLLQGVLFIKQYEFSFKFYFAEKKNPASIGNLDVT